MTPLAFRPLGLVGYPPQTPQPRPNTPVKGSSRQVL
jgi:hypothetical protein